MTSVSLNQYRKPIHERGKAFTLVELLVVLFLLMLLAGIALPNVKEMLSDQLAARAARSVTSYVDAARNRAISEGRQVGVLIERSTGSTPTDPIGRASAIRIRQLTDVPPYTGDASNSVCIVQEDGTNSVTTADFDPIDNQLLAVSASMVAASATDADDPQAPIRNGDYIEFPGGRVVPFTINYRALTEPATTPVRITFDLTESIYDSGLTTARFPSAIEPIPTDRPIKYKIHRRPVVSTVKPLDLPRGVTIDLNYSGIGVSGNQFAPDDDTTVIAPNIAIIFGPDGKIVSVTELYATAGGSIAARLAPPIGQVFLCLGESDGVRPDNLFAADNQSTANLRDPDSVWIVMNPSTGRVVSSPFAPVSTIPPAVVTDTADASLQPAILEARAFANLSDTVDLE